MDLKRTKLPRYSEFTDVDAASNGAASSGRAPWSGGRSPRRADAADQPGFYGGGFQHKHWVLFLCTSMVLCEWVDRSALSVAMQSIKEEFRLSDTQTGVMASASLWAVPLAVVLLGRLSDHVPRARLLGAGVFGWGAFTLATGCATSFRSLVLIRVCSGVSNSAGFPVALSLVADLFGAAEMTTALGYFHAGSSLGGLLGLALGGRLVTGLGWRWAFWLLGAPQLALAGLLLATVREPPRAPPAGACCGRWARDLGRLLRLASFRCLALGALALGAAAGTHRFTSAFVQRAHHVDARTFGAVFGTALGLTGAVSGWAGGHAVDWALGAAGGDHRVLLWCAALGELVIAAATGGAYLAPSFGLLVAFAVLAVAGSSLTRGIDTAGQLLARGRRGTAQSLLETAWSVGMGIGPFLTGVASDALRRSGACGADAGCGLRRALLLVGGICQLARLAAYLLAARHLRQSMAAIAREEEEDDAPTGEERSTELGSSSTAVAHAAPGVGTGPSPPSPPCAAEAPRSASAPRARPTSPPPPREALPRAVVYGCGAAN